MKTTLKLLLFALLLAPPAARAEWLTQSFELKAGWNAIYLHVDPSHTTIDHMVSADTAEAIQEVWLWQVPISSAQFILSPQAPTGTSSQWASWSRSSGAANVLQSMIGNAAYLVRVKNDAATYTWGIKGKVVPPKNVWTSSGLNLIGFSIRPQNAPSFEDFFSPAPSLLKHGEIFQYQGGELGQNNPAKLFAFRTTPVRRGEAFWMRNRQDFISYFGPFEVRLRDPSGIRFGTEGTITSLRLRNATTQDLTIRLEVVTSETPPVGQTSITDTPPLLLRGELDTSTLTYSFMNLNENEQTWTLRPSGDQGSEIDLVFGLNRSAMTGQPGAYYSAILRFTDSASGSAQTTQQWSQVDLPVAAIVSSDEGLWVGEAQITQVRHQLTSAARDSDGNNQTSSEGKIQMISSNSGLGQVARPFPLRLIVHNDATGANASLLQRVYLGIGLGGHLELTTQESLLLKDKLASARRISATHMPWTKENFPAPFTGQFQPGGSLTATISLPYDAQSSNPFLHTYHPDHDNLEADFKTIQPQGIESYGVTRDITLSFGPPAEDFAGLTGARRSLTGFYKELVHLIKNGDETKTFEVRGSFRLNRISSISTLTKPTPN